MGIPFIVAPTEAEAQCAVLAKAGKFFAAASEDMDTLTFSAPILFRHLTFSEAKKQPISEINLKLALEGLEMNMDQVRFSSVPCRPKSELVCHDSSSNYASFSVVITSNPSRVLAQNLR